MKRMLLYLFISFILIIGCDQKKSNENKSGLEPTIVLNETNKDTTHNYWELILDTIAYRKEFRISDIKHILELKTYSLNDSLVVRNLGIIDSQTYIDHSHTMVSDIKLFVGNTINQKRIEKTNFEKELIPEFYAECNLYSTQIDSIAGNIIYLASDLAIPDTDIQWRVWYSIKIVDNQLGKIEIKESDYVGL